jgi:REP element-mobilizing transposase RayT
VKFEKFPFKLEKQFRLRNWDYSSSGFYFVTICTKDRLKILGSVVVGTDLCVRSSENNNVRSLKNNLNNETNSSENINNNHSFNNNICSSENNLICSFKNNLNIHQEIKLNIYKNINQNISRNIHQNNNINLSDFGKSCHRIWSNIPKKFKNVILDDFIIMPDHIHGIICIKNDYQERTQRSVPTEFGNVGLLGQIIRWFKTISTNEYVNGVKKYNWPKFNKQIWQSRFNDRIIRSEKEFYIKKIYIKNNPKNWGKDKENV